MEDTGSILMCWTLESKLERKRNGQDELLIGVLEFTEMSLELGEKSK